MKEIPLTKGQVAFVDDEDHEWLSRYKWHAMRSGNAWYARRAFISPDGTHICVLMHREVLGLGKSMHTDHVDGNGLNNTRANLRPCSRSENMRNRRSHTEATSKFKGVSWCKDASMWRAQIVVDHKRIHLGRFDNEVEAARVYDAAALQYFGEFARPNFTVTQR
jgi:hypothetical protein